MPRKPVAKTSTERSRKSREISTLKRDMNLIEEILVQSDLPKRAQNFLESAFRKKFNRIQTLRGEPARASAEWKGSCYISQKDRVLRRDIACNNDALVKEGFVSGSAGVLAGAGPVPNTDFRLRTPEWLLDEKLLKEFRQELYRHRPRTAEVDLLSLVAYYLCRMSNEDVFKRYYSRHNPNEQYHRGQIRRDSKGGYTNLQTYRSRLVKLGYQWLDIPVPSAQHWSNLRNQFLQAMEDQKCKQQLLTATDPIAFESGETGGRPQCDFGYVHQKEASRLVREDEKRSNALTIVNSRTRNRRRERARQGLPRPIADQDRRLTRVFELIEAGRIRDLHALLVPTPAHKIETVSDMRRPEDRKAA